MMSYDINYYIENDNAVLVLGRIYNSFVIMQIEHEFMMKNKYEKGK